MEARRSKSRTTAGLVCLLVSWSMLAEAVVIDSADGLGNTTAPSPDPGWDHVGSRGGLGAIYLGDGWVLTANHVGAGDVLFGGVLYPWVPGSDVRLSNPDGSLADLVLFEIDPYPNLPDLQIVLETPPLDTELIMIGRGRNRGAATSWDPPGPPTPIGGYLWDVGGTMRWGRNFVEYHPPTKIISTWSFSTLFDEGVGPDEAQAAPGDSGGAAFAFDGSSWVLAGVLYAIGMYEGQPAETTLYGQVTHAADLAVYRDEIEQIIALPEPRAGLVAGVIALGWAHRLRSARSSGRGA